MAWDDWIPASRGDLRKLEKTMADQTNAQQQKIDAITAELGIVKTSLASTQADVTTLGTGVTTIEGQVSTLQDQITALIAAQSAGTPLDLTALTAAADELEVTSGDLKTAADAAVAKLPTPPTP